MKNNNDNKWFSYEENENADIRVFVFPYSGGNLQIFKKWDKLFDKKVQVIYPNYPGKGSRMQEENICCIEEFVNLVYLNMQHLLDKPFILFGHSNGALVSFKLANILEKNKVQNLKKVIISAKSAPVFIKEENKLCELPFEEFIDTLREFGNTPEEVINNKEIMQLLTPSLKADFAFSEYYEYKDSDKILTPTSIWQGKSDNHIKGECIEGWVKELGNQVDIKMFKGGHFFIEDLVNECFEELNNNVKEIRDDIKKIKKDKTNNKPENETILTKTGNTLLNNLNSIYTVDNSFIDKESNLIDDFLQYEPTPLSKIPIFLKESNTVEIKNICEVIHRLLLKTPEMSFGNDKNKIADFFYSGNLELAEALIGSQNNKVPFNTRFDLMFSKDGFKIVEVNAGSAMGGMLMSYYQVILEENEKIKNEINDSKFEVYKTLDKYFEFIVNSSLKYLSENEDLNIFLSTKDLTTNQYPVKLTTDLLNNALKLSNIKGNIFFGSLKELITNDNNEVYFKDRKIHSIINQKKEYAGHKLFNSYLDNKVFLPDNLWTDLAGHKSNLSLIRQLAEEGELSKEETKIVISAIPWSVNINNHNVFFEGKKIELIQYISKNKNKFVVKASDSQNGDDVYIGKFLSQLEWDKSIKKAMKQENGMYIVQEYIESVNLEIVGNNKETNIYEQVWGAYSFDEKYAGTFIRMLAKGTNKGLINTIRGSFSSLVFEKQIKD
jgi:surfactin synthase thioesterase subunit